MLIARIAALCLMVLAAPLAAQQTSEHATFRVGAGDHLRIDFYFQPDLSRVYSVRPDGSIALHLLGAVPVEGRTLVEIEELLNDRVMKKLQSTSSSVIVEIDRFRDIYVQGVVADPGAFPYQPGLTVMQTVALAGGTGTSRLGTQNGSSSSDLNRIFERQRELALLQSLIAKNERELKRLDAQLGEIESDDPLATLAERINATEIHGHETRRDIAEEESNLHGRNKVVLDTRLKRAEEEVERVNNLVSQGLVRADRLQQAEELADRFRSDILDLAADATRAARTGAEASNAAELARLTYHEKLLSNRERVSTDLQTARIEQRAVRGALRQLGGFPSLALDDNTFESWKIFRMGLGGIEMINASLDTRMMPGDVLMVVMQTPDDQ